MIKGYGNTLARPSEALVYSIGTSYALKKSRHHQFKLVSDGGPFQEARNILEYDKGNEQPYQIWRLPPDCLVYYSPSPLFAASSPTLLYDHSRIAAVIAQKTLL